MSATVRAGRRSVEITRPDKALFPSGITKLDLARYYDEAAPAMVRHVEARPLNLELYPDGIERRRIMQQHARSYFPDWVRRLEVPARDGTVEHVVANDAATLVYLAGQACITFHRWLSRADSLDRPDRFVIDLDPSSDTLGEVRRAAQIFGGLLGELGLAPWVMTTGSRGYHLVLALQRRLHFDDVRAFARDLSRLAVAREPGLFTAEQRKANRGGRILIDIQRNAYGQTAVAPYAVRARPNAPVATPLHWEELDDARTVADRWTMASIPERLEREGDPWREMARHAQTLTAARKRLDAALDEAGAGS